MTAAPTGTDRLPFEHPLGVHPRGGAGADVRIWAPRAAAVTIVPAGPDPDGDPNHEPDHAALAPIAPVALTDDGQGVWAGSVPWLVHGARYRVRIAAVTTGTGPDGIGPERDGAPVEVADPWSRSQPDGADGPSAAVDPAAIGAGPPGRAGRPPRPRHRPDAVVVYELHVGTFTTAGDLDAVVEHLGALADLGVTHVELMPVNEFPGDRGWGYDGIFWSAAHHAYGGPAALVRLVDAAHEHGLGMILDVVYNHLGPTGDQTFDHYGPFFTDKHHTPWGAAINVDGPGSGAVRETILQNAEWWVGAIGVDGLRVDACHAIVDQSARHVLAELTARVRVLHPDAFLVAESGLNDPHTVRAEDHGGWGFDADWADDLHHCLRSLLTGDRQGWYADFGSVAQLAKAFDRPYVHDGTWSAYRDRRFGAPAREIDPERFVVFAQDHDQVGNRPLGDRLPPEARALATLCVLASPFTPMLFMGEEYGEDAPFLFFSDHRDGFIADATRNGRRAEFADFTAATGEVIPDPQALTTFERSRLARRADPATVDLHRRLLALRRELPRMPVTTAFDEAAGWLRVERGTSVLLANLTARPRPVPCPPARVELATHPGTASLVTAEDPHLLLPAFAGALLWKDDDPA